MLQRTMTEGFLITIQKSILAFDPGTRFVGFALLQSKKENPLLPRDWAVKDAGVIRASLELSVSQRLALIHKSVVELMCEFNPDQIAIERAFHGKNPSSSIKLGEARGVLIGAASACGLPVMEYSPSHIKMTVAGFGNASKEQVALALQTILKFSRGALPADASDAVAIALTCGIAMSGTLGSKLSSQRFSDSNSRSR